MSAFPKPLVGSIYQSLIKAPIDFHALNVAALEPFSARDKLVRGLNVRQNIRVCKEPYRLAKEGEGSE